MSEDAGFRYVVELSLPSADSARAAQDVLRRRVIEMAAATGATVMRQELVADESSAYDPDGSLLAEFTRRLGAEVDLFAPKTQDRLDAPLSSILLHNNLNPRKTGRRRALNLMERDGIVVVRDVFIRGVEDLSDIRNLGDGSVDTVATAVGAYVPELPLMKRTSPIITARFYRTLDEIVWVRSRPRISLGVLFAEDAASIAERFKTDVRTVERWRTTWARYADEFNRAKIALKLRNL